MTTTDRGFLILHGWQNHRPPAHSQHRLADRLRRRGELVLHPQLHGSLGPAPVAALA